jgi:predicted DNA-binding transcriptional regulator YafY
MRASRLVALLLELQHRGAATAPELSRRLEVSVRTIYRDVNALQMAGVPLWTEPGPRGGIRLLEGWRSHLEALTGEEAMALALAGAPTAADDLGLGAVLLIAETKVRAILPPELRARSERVRERFHLDAPGWFHRQEDTVVLGPLAEAVWSSRRVVFSYGRGDEVVRRTVDPLGIVLKAGTWYLVARHRHQVRTYRVGRMRELDVRPETFARPVDFDLAAHWAASRGEFERSLLRYRCRLRLSPAALRQLPTVVDPAAGQAAVDAAAPAGGDGWRIVELHTESEQVAVGQLAALGSEVEVLEPRSLRAAMAEVGRSMARLNRAPADGRD